MPAAFRIIKKKYAATAFDGIGARQWGGRWNRKGVAMVYLSDTPSLAALEILVHADNVDLLGHYLLFELAIPDGAILDLPVAALPTGWRDYPAPDALADLGSEWAQTMASPVLSVPSVIIPIQRNLLLNPLHPDAPALARSAREHPFSFDGRLSRA